MKKCRENSNECFIHAPHTLQQKAKKGSIRHFKIAPVKGADLDSSVEGLSLLSIYFITLFPPAS